MGIRDERLKFSRDVVEKIRTVLEPEFGDIFQTNDNYATLTFEVGEFKGAPLYGSIKFTLHKEDYDLDEAIETFEDFDMMRVKRAEELARKRAEEEKKAQEREAKRKAK
jgi:hypothetical protein